MQGKKQSSEKMFTHFLLSERVPAENFYRRLKDVLHLQWLYKATKKYYAPKGSKVSTRMRTANREKDPPAAKSEYKRDQTGIEVHPHSGHDQDERVEKRASKPLFYIFYSVRYYPSP